MNINVKLQGYYKAIRIQSCVVLL